MSEVDQEIVNEESYAELLTGKKPEKKTRKPDPTKDSRWHAVRGLGYSINILSGFKCRAMDRNIPLEGHIILYCNFTIPPLVDKRNRLIAEIHKVAP